LPDDRYTITIKDSITDPANNKLDGESNAVEPLNIPSFPSGNGVPGGDFVARFTVNSRPHIGTYFSGTQFIDLNGNGVFDLVNKDDDQTNKDGLFKFGLNTDALFAGNFVQQGGTANGFSKLGAYGFVNGAYRWLLGFDASFASPSPPGLAANTGVVSGVQVNGLPVAFHFNPNLSGDQIGLFDGHGTWYIDYAGSNFMGPGTITVHDNLTGFPIVGDFDGNGQFDLATYRPDQKTFYFDLNPLASAVAPGAMPGPHVLTSLQFGFPSVNGRPVAADMNRDGVTDIGVFEPALDGTAPSDGVNWYFLVSSTSTPAPGTLNAINHSFSPTPFGTDLSFVFGHNQDLPLVGTFDPPVTSSPTTTTTTPAPAPAATLGLFAGLYQDVLGRTASNAELNIYAPAIADGLTAAQAVTIITSSSEAHARVVTQYYQQYLHRAPDPTGLAGWVSMLDHGGHQQDVLLGILGSNEYFGAHGGTAAGFVQGLYQDLLHRTAGPKEVPLWTALAATSRPTVISDILGSSEYDSGLVNLLYTDFLDRSADAAGLAGWVKALQHGLTDEQLTRALLGSDEYRKLHP
jgi:hypothetical protein